MKNIYILPTEKPSRLWLSTRKENYLIFDKFPKGGAEYVEPKHIYITSDEEIKDGDWYIYLGQINKRTRKNPKAEYPFPNYQKIILTTDQDLIKDGVQEIDDEFIEWFVKNPSCDFVMTIPDVRGLRDIFQPTGKDLYKIIIPKEEPKQETLEVMKKEQTIEQASEYYAHNYFDMHETNNYQALKQGFINGAKWQQKQDENLYSEEDLREAFRQGELNINYSEMYGLDSELTEQQWFEQFKKK